MPLLPPNHIPLPVAAVYIVASVLQDAHTAGPRADDPSPFSAARLFVTRRAPDGARAAPPPPRILPGARPPAATVPPGSTPQYFMVCTGLRVTEGSEPGDLGVVISFRDADGQTFYTSNKEGASSSVAGLDFFLRPPAVDCLSNPRLRDGLNSVGLISLGGPPPEDLVVSAASFERRAVTRYRQALALGLLQAVVIDKDGCKTPIPAAFWPRDEAEAYFSDQRPLSVEIEGRPVRGHVFVDVARLGAEWRRAFRQIPASALMAEAVFDPLGYVRVDEDRPSLGVLPDFMDFVGRDLGIVDGRGPDGLPIQVKTLKPLLEWWWDHHPATVDIPMKPGFIEAMLTLLRHHDDQSGGNRPNWSKLNTAKFDAWEAEERRRGRT
ncbi:hypothetical protein SAMN04488144_14521 [Methylobacterium sp. 190mf]|uniref:hypothetical protein n=1 Tax=Methylobacterium sp. 190mf TaxID=1761798 RepID=UPI00089E6D2C|nr:hypothetical protein [Methylobacterium sp. 190mf]SEG69694.1 hypothetical protein SAMN04488144_14521 [Methylobacterium sp. 190mf]